MDNDQTLWNGLRTGDREMFLSLYKKYYHPLLFIGLKEIKDAQLVKDTIQQLFLYLWEKRENLGDARNPKSYLVTSFLRKLTTDWKQSGKANQLLANWQDLELEPPSTPEEKLIYKDEQGQLNKVLMRHINQLPNRQRELIVLKFYEGLSYEEIVEKTGLSHRTVYNKIHEAIKTLKLEIASNRFAHSAALVLLLPHLIYSCFTAALF